MPFARFDKLAPAKRERLLEVAAQEFARAGCEDASINRILEQARMSKGAANYYFADKVDLLCTVVQYCSARLGVPTLIPRTPAKAPARSLARLSRTCKLRCLEAEGASCWGFPYHIGATCASLAGP